YSQIIVELQPAFKSLASEDLAERLWQGLNNEVGAAGIAVSGARFTTSRNLLLTITPPHTSQRFMAADVQDRLRAYLVNALQIIDNTPIWVYPAGTWPRVVVHRLQLDYRVCCKEDALRDVMLKLLYYNPTIQAVPAYMLTRARFLTCFSNKALPRSIVSVCIPVRDMYDVKRLMKDGIYADGRHHRVYIYRASSNRNRFNS
ncbi:hypothetical protein CVT26_005390, partial [Gymnopilus dilepis]